MTSKFGKRHYVVIAERLRGTWEWIERGSQTLSFKAGQRQGFKVVVSSLGDIFESDNPLFNRKRFEGLIYGEKQQ